MLHHLEVVCLQLVAIAFLTVWFVFVKKKFRHFKIVFEACPQKNLLTATETEAASVTRDPSVKLLSSSFKDNVSFKSHGQHAGQKVSLVL